jgi:F1F0 ATPase subunit 2
MMNETIYMIFAFIAGLVLGTLFFGGLWFTVKKAVTAKIPALWIFSSFFLRIGITLVGFYFISSGNWKRLLICVTGFIIARFFVIHFTKLADEKQMQFRKEVGHEA